MPTVSEVQTILSRYAGSGNTFLSRLNEVVARYRQSGNWKGTKEQIELTVYSDRANNSIVTLPRKGKAILAGAVLSPNTLCAGSPMGVLNGWQEFSKNGLGYGGLSTDDFQEVEGRFAVFQEWSDPMYIRLKFEVSESSGVVHLKGKFNGDDIYSSYSGSWILGEKIAFSGTTTVTSSKKFDALGFSAVKPVTNGRISVYCVDDDDVETLVGVWEPTETVPRRRRYKVPACDDVSSTEATTTTLQTQFYSKAEIDAMFARDEAITVSSTGTTDLVYAAYLLRVVPITAEAGTGAYTRKFTLDNSTVKDGGTLRIVLEVAASANPTLSFYDNTISGTLLTTITGDSDNAQYMTLIFSYEAGTGTWHYEGREV